MLKYSGLLAALVRIRIQLMKDCQFGVSPVNYSDSDQTTVEGVRAVFTFSIAGECSNQNKMGETG